MKFALRLAAAAAVALSLGAAHAETFQEATPSTAQFNAAVVGGPVGTPTTVVLPSPSSGALLDVGQAFSASLAPVINATIQALLALGLGWLVWLARTKLNVSITADQQKTLQQWLTNQASSLIADGAVSVAGGKIVVKPDVLAKHAEEAAKQIPDAIAFFNMSPDLIASKIVDKLPQVPGSPVAPVPPTA